MDSRLAYLMTLLPPLPPLGAAPPISQAETLRLVRQQGGADLTQLADLLEAESSLRSTLDEWLLNPPGSRVVPRALPQALQAIFDEDRVAGTTEEPWIDSLWQAYLELLAAAARRHGCGLLARWAAWDGSLRLHLAHHRARLRGDRGGPGRDAPPTADPGLEATLAAWVAARSRNADADRLGTAMEAELALDRARLAFLERETPRYSFTLDELAAYLLHLRLLERHQRLDRQRGRSLLKAVAAL